MTGWLIRSNLDDASAPFSEMPPELVLRQSLKHEVVSSLGLFRGRHRIGSVTVTPLNSPGNAFVFDGNLQIPQEGQKPHTYGFSLHLDLNEKPLSPKSINLRINRRQPPLSALIDLLLAEKKVRYQIKEGDVDMGSRELPLSGDAFSLLLPTLTGLPSLPSATTLTQSLKIRANRANFKIKGERVDGFRIKLDGAGLSATATIGQLGEIFVVRTTTEYHLLAEGLDPQVYLP